MSIIETQEKLVSEIVYVKGSYAYQCKWDDYIQALEVGIDLVTETLQRLECGENNGNDTQINSHEILVTKTLLEELLNVVGATNPPEKKRNYRLKKIYELSCILREKLEQIPDIVPEKEEITSFNHWIKSLKIFKLNHGFVSSEYYQSRDDLYGDLRKIVLQRTPPLYKMFYARKVADLLEKENDGILKSDYELSELVRLVQGNKEFDYRNDWNYQKASIQDRIEREFYHNHLKSLIK